MAEDLSSLGEDELSNLVQVIESLERSTFDFLELDLRGMKVVLGKGDPAGYVPRPKADPVAAVPASASPQVSSEAAPSAPPDNAEEGTVEIRSPMVGMFYAQPEPGSPPYVSVGSVVQEDTTVALLEVMKMFNAVSAGVEGTVTAILAEDNQLVQYGQPLFRVRRHDD
ncbi:biotin/lipoyl-containing protein [Amycolatopsis sp. GM8]|uniref:acetyl-CoA carboxylase biotin carboxyl carrier protein n=1 Tax=Amycolatopsis sp. GM8 TaxID=2896530 RepID=UPI001F25A6AE|nr:biotin/lipoyl-containing protein [Amycolatopsis sp. GM8]